MENEYITMDQFVNIAIAVIVIISISFVIYSYFCEKREEKEKLKG